MYARTRAADAAKRLLRTASHRLMTPDPTTDRVLTQSLDRSLDWRLAIRAPRRAEASSQASLRPPAARSPFRAGPPATA